MDDKQLVKILRGRINFAVNQFSNINTHSTDLKIKKMAEDAIADLLKVEEGETNSISPEE